MPNTKKMLVAFDPNRPESRSSDFLIPLNSGGRPVLYGVKSQSEHTLGLAIYLGRAITENDLFAKLVDSGLKIENVAETLTYVGQYIDKLQSVRIGNVVRLQPSHAGAVSFELEVVANTPTGFLRQAGGE